MSATMQAQRDGDGEMAERRWLMLAMVAAALAVVVPLMAMLENRPEYQAAGFSTVAPFVFRRVALFQLIFNLPALWFVSFKLGKWIRLPLWLPVVVGVALTLVAAILAETLAAQSMTSGVAERHALRLVWCAVLQLPWAWLAATCVHQMSAESRRGWRSLPWVDALIVATLLVLPVIFVREEIERQETLIDDLFRGKQQYQAALDSCHRISALGVEQILERPASTVINGLTGEVTRIKQAVAEPLAATADAAQRLQRSIDLISLGRFDLASEHLSQLESPRAKYHAARIEALQRDWIGALNGFGDVIEDLKEQRPLGDNELSLLRAAMERRVNNLRRAGRFRQAESELKQAIVDWPAARDRLLLQLALHYKLAGRGADAVEYFLQAADANPQLSEMAVREISLLRGQAQGCLIRINRAASR